MSNESYCGRANTVNHAAITQLQYSILSFMRRAYIKVSLYSFCETKKVKFGPFMHALNGHQYGSMLTVELTYWRMSEKHIKCGITY